ncbi:MAG: DNA-3-methyladenine glycosylase [Candidatus Lokiarchaeota archaeon]|nr:DNA-3-methyladenine glycosylase [Candidatus Lokiarchaeota archaeon]
MELQRINRQFFNRDTEKVARELLGKYLIRETDKGKMIAKIIEVEAYVGPEDKASHSYKFRKTERTQIMYEKPGILYVYLIYGMYHCLNVVTEPEGVPCAVLIRQLYPIQGIELMKENRNVKLGKKYKNLLDGPGKLCIAFNISKNKLNGKDSCLPNAQLYFSMGESIAKDKIISEKRIGIDYAGEDKDRLLRFLIVD